ncbi:MAG: ATP--guanido phosphotransferase [Eubacteriales bacterium]|nr:ATP--guanido phosphotransferase [Eubacteriales bacterium]
MNELYFAAPEQDVAVSSRVRLARNYQDAPYMPKMTEEWAEETIRRASEAMMNAPDATAYEGVRMKDLSENEQQELVEHRLISYDLLKYTDYAAALLSSGRTVSVMINEEDHVRVQGLLPGLQLERAAELAFRADDSLSQHAAFAFDRQWGYLTACPANAGTGMRASVILHLPALQAAGQLGALGQNMAKIGITIRGVYGEGSDALGGLYLLSNQATLGRSEEDILRSLEAAAAQICTHERELREGVLKQDRLMVEDKLMRSVGVLREARILRLDEFMKHMSDLRLACAVGVLDAPLHRIDELIMDLQPGSLCARAKESLSQRQIDEMRAAHMREAMRRAPIAQGN